MDGGGNGGDAANSGKHGAGHVCQICGDGVGTAADGELFTACDVCGFPVCRPCYEYERKDGTQACPQCKTKYKRHKGSPPVHGEENEDVDADDVSDYNYQASGNQDQKQKIAERMLTWRTNSRGSDIGLAKYDSGEIGHGKYDSGEIPRGYIPSLTHSQISGEIPGASPDHMMSPVGNIGRRGHQFPYVNHSPNPSREFSGSLGNVAWKERVDGWKMKDRGAIPMTNGTSIAPSEGRGLNDIDASTDYNMEDALLNDETRQPLSRKVPIPSSRINPYRMVIVLRLVVLCIFLRYRITHPVNNAYPLWLLSVICEIWFALSWILDQFPKWSPINRETYLDRLALRYDREGEPSQLAPVDIFVSTVDPMKEPPLVTANTVLSILAVDYPVDKVSCYVSDDGAAMLTFDALSETSEFARKWVPFCKKYNIEPRAPEWYFAQKIDYLKDKVQTSFVKERRAMKREYEEFKVRINALVAKAQKVPEEGWIMQDGTPWPGNNTRDHPGMIQVFLGHSGGLDVDGNELPRLVYVSREKRPGFQHHKKAGAMNALVRVSAVLTNGQYMLNLDCDHYINNSKALREAMCFLMDPNLGRNVCYVQFPQRFDGIDRNDRYANRNTVFFDVSLRYPFKVLGISLPHFHEA